MSTSMSERKHSEPTPAELAEALESVTDEFGAVPAGVARRLSEERGWGGRLIDVLSVLTENADSMAYLAGGRRPDEVATWVALWAESSLSLEQIRLVVADRGWDPEPFVALAAAGLLERTLIGRDGLPRVIHGELAGGWVSDELALADDSEVVRRVLEVLGDETPAFHGGDAAGPPSRQPLPQEEYDAIYARVPRLTVEVVITSAGGVLLARRLSGPCEGLWHLPGGTVRLGEPLTEAVTRVAREELGIEVLTDELLGYIEYPSHLARGLGWPVGIAFRARPLSLGYPSELSRDDLGWFSSLPKEMHDEQREFIAAHVLQGPVSPGVRDRPAG